MGGSGFGEFCWANVSTWTRRRCKILKKASKVIWRFEECCLLTVSSLKLHGGIRTFLPPSYLNNICASRCCHYILAVQNSCLLLFAIISSFCLAFICCHRCDSLVCLRLPSTRTSCGSQCSQNSRI